MSKTTYIEGDLFNRVSFNNSSGEELTYLLSSPKDNYTCKKLIVYIHGLVSDFSWFTHPKVEEGTAVLFIQRQPKTDVVDFFQWYNNYRNCLEHCLQKLDPTHVHLVANCFGSYLALLWATKKPETFCTITLCNPPTSLRKRFSIKDKLSILFSKDQEKEKDIYLDPEDFCRLQSVQKFIEEDKHSSFSFTYQFYRNVLELQRWLDKFFIGVPMPLLKVVSTEDKIVNNDQSANTFWSRVEPEETLSFSADHFLELLPQHDLLWSRVMDFQSRNETQKKITGKIKKVLVTGASGFLGSHIIFDLLDKGYEVIGLVRDTAKAKKFLGDAYNQVTLIEGDLESSDSLEGSINSIDLLIHVAAKIDDWGRLEDFKRVNVESTKTLLTIAHKANVKQVVLIGSQGIYGGPSEGAIDENSQWNYANDFYSNTKIEQELFTRKYCRQNQIPLTIVRPCFIYGEGENIVISRIIDLIKAGNFKYIGDGQNRVRLVYVKNVVALVSKVIGNEKCLWEAYNIGNREEVTLRTFIEDISKGMDIPPPEKQISKQLASGLTEIFEKSYRTLGIHSSAPPLTSKKLSFLTKDEVLDASKAYELLEESEIISYRKGIEKTFSDNVNKG